MTICVEWPSAADVYQGIATMKQKTKKGRENYGRVVDAAQDLFYRRGYERTSFSELAKASGMNRGSFYFYFETKQNILEAVVERRSDQLAGALQTIDARTDDPQQRLHLYLDFARSDQQENLLFGCPIGSLAGETAKEHKSCLPVTIKLVDQSIDWLSVQLTHVAGPQNGRPLALDLFGRLQGAALLTAVYSDTGLFETQMAGIAAWTEVLFSVNRAGPRGPRQ